MMLALMCIKVCAILENICQDWGEQEQDDNISSDPVENVPNIREGRPRVAGTEIVREKAVRDWLLTQFRP